MNILPENVKEVVDEHIKAIELSLPKLLVGYYIYGSVSLGAYNYCKSDIDFLAVMSRQITDAEIVILKKIHSSMQRKYNKTILDGMYLIKEDFEYLTKGEITCLRFNDGIFKGNTTFDTNSVDAYELKSYGITIMGQDIKNLNYTVDFDILINNMYDNINTYWRNWVNTHRKFPSLRYMSLFVSLTTIEWGVLGISRLYYTFNEKDITSKLGAGEYALMNVHHRWHKIIKEAMRLRKNNKNSYYNSIIKRQKDALDYIDYMIQECNNLVQSKE